MGSEGYLEAHSQQRALKDGSDLYLEAAEDDDNTSNNSNSKPDEQDGEAVVV